MKLFFMHVIVLHCWFLLLVPMNARVVLYGYLHGEDSVQILMLLSFSQNYQNFDINFVVCTSS